MTDTEETSEISSSAQLGLQGLLNANPLNVESTEPESANSAENTNRTMNDLESDSILPDDKDVTSRKLITTGRSNDLDDNASTPAIIESTSDNIHQGPRRSISESALKDHHDTFEQTSTLPIQQDENSADEEETTTDREVADVSHRSSNSKSPLNRPQAPIKSPVQLEPSSSDEKPESRAASSSEQSKLIKQGEKLQIPANDIDSKSNNSPPPSPITKNLITTNPILANHSRQTSQSSINKQKSKTNSAASRKSKTPSESSKQQQQQSPYQTEKNKSHSSAASSRTETPTNDSLIKRANIPALQTTTDDETQASRPQTPTVEQIAERNQPSSKSQKQIQAERRANSVESFNRIRLVDDKSLDSVSGTNIEEQEQTKPRRIKSKKKDAESNTDSYNSNHQQQQQQESTSRKPSKTNKSMTEKSPSIRRHIRSKAETPTPDTEPEITSPKLRHSSKTTKENIENEQIKTASFNNERQTLSDTEQILGDKQKKRRRPKRISRTTQTYECVFRRMEYGQHDELRPVNDTEKNIQTKKSFLRPRNTSPKKHYPIAISTDELKIEEIFPKQSPQQSRNATRTSVTTQNTSSTTSKLLLLRPTLPIQHAESLNVQRISVHYNIDLTPKENKPTTSTPDLRNNKLQTNNNSKPNEEKNTNLPNIHPLPNKFNGKEKINTNKKDDKTQPPRKPVGNV